MQTRGERECNATRITNARSESAGTNMSSYVEFVGGVTKPKRSGEVNYTLIPRNREYTPRVATKDGYIIRRKEMRSSNAKRDPDTELNYLKLAFKLHLESNYLKRVRVRARALPPASLRITRISRFVFPSNELL